MPQQLDDDAAAEHRADEGCEVAEPRPVDQAALRPGLGPNADHQREQHQRNKGADQGFLENEGAARGLRGVRGAG
ncbi:hypothetical protein ABIF07_009162 [Bradyrhizobium elkanii]